MKKTYQIEVDCANCANLMEEAAKKTAGVQNAVVNFMTQKMIVEFSEGQDPKAVMQAVLKACKKVSLTARSRCKAQCRAPKTCGWRGAFSPPTIQHILNYRFWKEAFL